MEPEVQEAQEIPRGELDTAFDVSRATGWMVVQSVPTKAWGYELWSLDRTWREGVPSVMDLPEDRQRHSYSGSAEGGTS